MPPKRALLTKGQPLGIMLSRENTVEEVRPNSNAACQGIEVGMSLATVNNQPVDAQTFGLVVQTLPDDSEMVFIFVQQPPPHTQTHTRAPSTPVGASAIPSPYHTPVATPVGNRGGGGGGGGGGSALPPRQQTSSPTRRLSTAPPPNQLTRQSSYDHEDTLELTFEDFGGLDSTRLLAICGHHPSHTNPPPPPLAHHPHQVT